MDDNYIPRLILNGEPLGRKRPERRHKLRYKDIYISSPQKFSTSHKIWKELLRTESVREQLCVNDKRRKQEPNVKTRDTNAGWLLLTCCYRRNKSSISIASKREMFSKIMLVKTTASKCLAASKPSFTTKKKKDINKMSLLLL